MIDHALLQALPAPVYTTDAEGGITFFNEAAVQLWGHRPKLGDKWCGSWKLYYSDGRPMAHEDCPMAETLKTGKPVRGVEAFLERPDGARIPFEPYPTPLFDADGKLIGAINMMMDISYRSLGQQEAARLAAIVATSDDAIISKTLNGIVLSWNAGAERIFGYEPREMIGQPILKLIPPELQSEETEIISKLSQGIRLEHYETVRLAKGGRQVHVSLTVSPLRDRLGKIVGASKIARDITERKRAEETQALLLNELNHRIKNTLATVQAIASQTLRRSASPALFVTSFNGRIQSLARAHTLLTGRTLQGADVRDLVHDQLLLGGAEDQRISTSGPSLMLDPQAALHLALVLHELGTNARKHGALSTGTGSVSVAWEMHTNGGRHLVMKWRETGGPKVVAPTTAGFGTTLIEQSLRPHGGEVSMRYGETGVSCTIEMPLTQIAADVRHEPLRSSLQRSQPEGSLVGKRVLVVEDEALIAMVIEEYLIEAGCSVLGPAPTPAKALKLIQDEGIDLALLDGNLAGRPVDEVAAALTQKGVPFAFVTGYGREALPPAFQDAVAVEKPFTREQILAALEQLLGAGGNVVQLKLKKP